MASATIYVRLLNEGTDVWRPSPADHVRDDIYQITGSSPDETETWQFSTGDKVHCRLEKFSDGKMELVVFERA
jgi:hypothetical protein